MLIPIHGFNQQTAAPAQPLTHPPRQYRERIGCPYVVQGFPKAPAVGEGLAGQKRRNFNTFAGLDLPSGNHKNTGMIFPLQHHRMGFFGWKNTPATQAFIGLNLLQE